MARAGWCRVSEDRLPHSYKELNISADAGGRPRLDPEHLHIWPRGQMMLIALPNADHTFTATLFMPAEGGPISFEALRDSASARQLFEREFPDALALMEEFDHQYDEHPVGQLATIRTDSWHAGGMALLIGDAAHAIVPFHGQGLNCCFEDCLALDALLEGDDDWETVFRRFTAVRRPNADAIADMALENYVEMRDTVRSPHFLLQKELSLALERRHPERFIPRYSMVMFHAEIPYAIAQQRGAIQAGILDELTTNASTLAEVDLVLADSLIEGRLSHLGAPSA
jgi:kynurenine 3-monooxygenase